MIIAGFQKTTLLDFPGHVAATIFVSGCNMRCPFCHNMDIVLSKPENPVSEEEIFKFLKKRIGILDGICITGGEPTLYSDLPSFIAKVKELGYKVKLDTNGTNPAMLKSLIDNNLLDYIAMDIKSSLNEYPIACGIPSFDVNNIVSSINILKSSSVDYEFRTTLVNELHNTSAIEEIGQLIKGSPNYYLQAFVDSDFVPDHSFTSPNKEELLSYKKQLSKFVSNVEIRGIDI